MQLKSSAHTCHIVRTQKNLSIVFDAAATDDDSNDVIFLGFFTVMVLKFNCTLKSWGKLLQLLKPRPIKSDSLKEEPDISNFLKLPREFQCMARIENHCSMVFLHRLNLT